MEVNEDFRNRRRGDEFYTRYDDVAREMKHYNLTGMVVYCNTDNPESSKFVSYFRDNFKSVGIKKLMATFNTGKPFLYEYDGVNERRIPIQSGLFQDNINLIRKCDVVITNPPFSGGLPLKLIQMLMGNGKKFIIIAPLSLIQKKAIFEYVKTGQLSVGNNTVRRFETPSGDSEKITAVWWTNMRVNKEKLNLTKKYDERLYPKYDNFDAIDSRTNDIPSDYPGYIGVPISFISRFNPSQFDLVGILNHPKINGKGMMSRIIIKRKAIRESRINRIIVETINDFIYNK
jgi:hypothetical protein